MAKKEVLQLNMPIAQAIGRGLYKNFKKMMGYEAGTRLGEDREELHEMRVATRRLRAIWQVGAPYMRQTQTKEVWQKLRQTTKALGRVRDLDVFWEQAEHYLNGQYMSHEQDLAPLYQVWFKQYNRERPKLLAYLDSSTYWLFKEQFSYFAQELVQGERDLYDEFGEPMTVGAVFRPAVEAHLQPVLAFDEAVQQHTLSLTELHELRIKVKMLRYTLEFFEDVLPGEWLLLFPALKKLQSCLGNIQDGAVVCASLRDFLVWGKWGRPKNGWKKWPVEPVLAAGVARYLAVRQEALEQEVHHFRPLWQEFYVLSAKFQVKELPSSE